MMPDVGLRRPESTSFATAARAAFGPQRELQSLGTQNSLDLSKALRADLGQMTNLQIMHLGQLFEPRDPLRTKNLFGRF